MMNIDLSEIERKTVSVNQYLEGLDPRFRETFSINRQTYQPKLETMKQLKEVADRYVIVAFSAGWCKDCSVIISILALISEATGLKVRIFGGLKKDPLSHSRKWRIPPSPPEVETFNVDRIPLVVVINKEGKEIGRVIEKPTRLPTLEEELLEIAKCQQ